MYKILLYYKYVDIDNPERLRDEQKALCEKLNLKGRIIIAKEGINGTVEGEEDSTNAYMKEMKKNPFFKDMSYKISDGTGNAFPRLRIRVRPEIVTSGFIDLNPNKITGKYLSHDELYRWFEEKKEFYIVDMRNDYEYISGFFEGFIPSGMKNFYELKDVPERIKHLKNKTVVTVCTGGVRCEKASGFLVENGFEDVYQLKDGIQTFMEKYPNKYFKGKLYVFDNRLTFGFNTESKDHEVVGSCMLCSKKSDRYVNCEYDVCHRHFICCLDCVDKETGFAFCDNQCKENWSESRSKKRLPFSAVSI